MPKITDEKLKAYFLSGGSIYPLYTDSVKLYNELKIHADGLFPSDMISSRRPSENEEILEYRKATYKAVTKLPVSKVINSFGKIRRSPDWMINFPKEEVSSKIAPEETLEKYCTEKLPGYISITNWAFGILLKQNLIDSNAIIAVVPTKSIVADEYTQPCPIVFNSDQVMEFNEQEKYAILKSKRKVRYQVGTLDNISYQTGDIFYYIDDLEVTVYEQSATGFTLVFTVPNVTKQFCVWKVKAESFKQFDNMSLNKSRLDGMVPFLDEAACEYSDLKGSKIQHLYPLFWYFQNKACNACNGVGKKAAAEGSTETVPCTVCDGSGHVKFSPFAHIQVDPAALGAQSNPVPPAGYVTRDTKILELQEASVDKNLFRALGAMNMQFLDQTPLAISGDAKNVDREELNNTVYTVAEDLIYSIDKAIYFINEWRYGYIVPDQQQRKEQLPNIPVPQNFDLLPEDYLMKEITDARNGKITPLLIGTLEQQLAAKKFYNQPDLASNIKLCYDLDPLPGLSVDDKIQLLTNKGIMLEDYILSAYLPAFIKRAIREYEKFATYDWEKQMEMLMGYVKEKKDANDEAQKMIDEEKQKVLDEMNAAAGGGTGAPVKKPEITAEPAK